MPKTLISKAPRVAAARALARAGDSISPADPSPDVAIEDWDTLFGGLVQTLTLNASDWLASTLEPSACDPAAARARANLQECAAGLQQLHSTLVHEFQRHQELESEVVNVRTALAHARAEESKARLLSLHDSLTTLPNRACFSERLDAVVASANPQRQKIAVLYVDLDDFKPINDSHGHNTGDEVLRIVAMRLSHAIRCGDMVSRFGGDEFACLLAGSPGRDHLSHLACKLLDAVSAPMQIGALTLTVRPSIGIAMWPADGVTPQALLRNADAAMYRAKRQKCGYAFFEEAVDAAAAQASP
jgi:diguanylate cyclase